MPFGALQLVRQAYRTPEIKKPTIASWVLRRSCGERGIRTPDTVSRIHTFQACSFNHSDTSPWVLWAANIRKSKASINAYKTLT
jgi:hypothetical protein